MEIQNSEKIIEAIQHISLKQVHLSTILQAGSYKT